MNPMDRHTTNFVTAQIELARKQLQVEVQRQRDFETVVTQDTQVFGKFRVNGAGEATKAVEFPVVFSNIPLVTFGIEIQSDRRTIGPGPEFLQDAPGIVVGQSSGLVKGEAPVITAAVVDWYTEDVLPDARRYSGCEVLTTCVGALNTKFVVHWSAAGVAFTNPSVGSPSGNFKDRVYDNDPVLHPQVQFSTRDYTGPDGQAPGTWGSGYWQGVWYGPSDGIPPGYP